MGESSSPCPIRGERGRGIGAKLLDSHPLSDKFNKTASNCSENYEK